VATFKKAGQRLPPPPPVAEARDNLRAPEVAPPIASGVDRRSLRATGRTEQFATRVTEKFHREFKSYAALRGRKINELLEDAFEALKEKHHREGR
jgi:hypothetical protein